MTWIADHWIQLALIGAYFTMLVHHALAGRKEPRSVGGYLVANRNLVGVVIALSFYATFMSTNTFIGASGKSWEHGLSWCVGGLVLTGRRASRACRKSIRASRWESWSSVCRRGWRRRLEPPPGHEAG